MAGKHLRGFGARVHSTVLLPSWAQQDTRKPPSRRHHHQASIRGKLTDNGSEPALVQEACSKPTGGPSLSALRHHPQAFERC